MATETQTVTYDPENDTLIDEANQARDAETLAVGEKMMAEQENLLAGKYKSTEELEKAYLELQKSQGSKEETTETEEQQPEINAYQEDGSINWDTAKQHYGDQLSATFEKADIDPFKMNEYFVNNNGTLSDEMYEQLDGAGFSKSVVDSYLQGVRQEVGMESATPAPSLNETEVKEIHAIAGGEEGYDALMSWATDNLSDADAENFDKVIETGNKAAVTFAVKALMGQYEDPQGRDPTLIQGKQSTPDTYRSMAEVVRDMNNPLYEQDEAYRDDVRRKLAASNLKV